MSMSRWCSVPGPHTGPAGIRRRLGRGPRPEARGPAAAAGSGVFGYTILDSARPVQRRRQAASGRRRVHVGRHRHGTHTVPTRYRGQYAPRTLCWHAKLATDSTPKFERDGQLLRGFLADGLCTDRGRLASILEGNIARAQAQQCILCHSESLQSSSLFSLSLVSRGRTRRPRTSVVTSRWSSLPNRCQRTAGTRPSRAANSSSWTTTMRCSRPLGRRGGCGDWPPRRRWPRERELPVKNSRAAEWCGAAFLLIYRKHGCGARREKAGRFPGRFR